MRFVRQPSETEKQELERMTRQEVGRVGQRAHMILLSARHFTIPEIADIFETSEVTLYHWYDRFEAEGPSGLYDRPRSGRPPQLDEAAQADLEETLSQPPTEQGYNLTYWTVPLLTTYLEETLQTEVCPETVRTTLHDLGFRWRRPRWTAPPAEPAEVRSQMQSICQAIVGADPETVVLLEDETLFKSLPPLRQMWIREGQQHPVPTPAQNERFYLYGALELYTGHCVQAPFERANSEHTLAYLQQLLAAYPDRPILLIWDQASYHTSQLVERWLADQDRIEVLSLPKRVPKLNPMEAIWRQLKDQVAANLTRSLADLKAACVTFFEQHSSTDLLRMAGLLPVS